MINKMEKTQIQNQIEKVVTNGLGVEDTPRDTELDLQIKLANMEFRSKSHFNGVSLKGQIEELERLKSNPYSGSFNTVEAIDKALSKFELRSNYIFLSYGKHASEYFGEGKYFVDANNPNNLLDLDEHIRRFCKGL